MVDLPLRAGVIGLGIGQLHAEGYHISPDATLVALCDADELRLHDFGHKYNVPPEGLFTNYQRMLAEAKLDVLSVCLPNFLHAEVSIAALNAGVHVLCEKPLAPTVAQAQEILDAAKRNDRRLIVGYNFRYRTDIQWIYRLVQAGQLGDIYHIYASWRRETGIPGGGWFGNLQLAGGGVLIDLGVHVLDLTLWLLGFPAVNTVSGDIRSLFGPHGLKTWGRRPGQPIEPSFDVDDGAVGFIRFANGANATLEVTWAEHRQPADDLIHMEIQGTKGTVVLKIPNYTWENTLAFYTEMEGEPVTITPKVRLNGLGSHEMLVLDTAHRLRYGEPLPANGEQGLVAVQILQAIYESAKVRHEINMPILEV
ncbi:MAG: Gfo/Idh/MocA family oxidoreductase [Chloroflexota bacterium]